MGERTSIEWTRDPNTGEPGATWNPWTGCDKVSSGCKNCYAERIVARWGRDFSVVKRSKTTFDDPLRWRKGRMVFTCSMSDFFHESADSWRDEAWEIIQRTPRHTYQILTKRPERIKGHLPRICFYCAMNPDDPGPTPSLCLASPTTGHLWWPWPNVWLGTSVEMDLYMSRVYILLRIPARVHFLSAEPLLGPLNLSPTILAHKLWIRLPDDPPINYAKATLDWVITGGESDPHNPRLSPELNEWFRSIRDACATYGVPFFLKQLGGTTKCSCHGSWGCRLLDGRTHDGMPSGLSHLAPSTLDVDSDRVAR